MYFPSRKNIWLFFMIWGYIFFIIFIYIFGGDPVGMQFNTYKSVLGYITGILILIFLLWIWFGTGYKIENGQIIIIYGPIKRTFNIDKIKKIRKIKSPFTRLHISVDRLEIHFGKYDVITISPKDDGEFLRLLIKENSHIQIDE